MDKPMFSLISRRKRQFAGFIYYMLFGAVTLSFANKAFAESLDEAKSKGLVGETQSGYLAAVNPAPSPSIAALVADINAKRKEQYFSIAQKNGTPLSAVEALAAKKAIDATPAGQFVQSPSGTWSKK